MSLSSYKPFVQLLSVLLLSITWASPSMATKNSARNAEGVVDVGKCGALDQPVCKNSAATFVKKKKNPKPDRAFTDPRKGGEYWVCPKDRPR